MVHGIWSRSKLRRIRHRINNGYAGKFAYLGQYFEAAYTIDTNGVITTNSDGLVSPYGEFFATTPGPAALVTMPDIETGQRGTGVVNVIKLQLDVNHDGEMDLSYGGPDNTSATRPFVFWVNNDWDEPGNGSKPDRDIHGPKHADYAAGRIRSQRNLEDFARLWICGIPALPQFQDYTVTLSWRNTTGNPAVNIYASCESDGGIGYLTDTNIAAAQIDSLTSFGTSMGAVSSTQAVAFVESTFVLSSTQHLLFEGAGIGSGELVMSVSKGSNVLAQTSAWLDLHDVKDFYERAVITNSVSGAVSNMVSGVQTEEVAKTSALGDDQELIVLVHGINVSPVDWLVQSDTVLKRLYWAGYRGKFAAVKWPCAFLTPPSPLTLNVFNLSEMRAYKSASALKTYIEDLHGRFAESRLHLLVHSQGNAVASEAIEQGATVDTYIITQGALPASAYDVDAPLHSGLSAVEALYGPTPEWKQMGYRGVYTNLPGRIVNFYNANDPVLTIWINDQGAAKPNVPATDYHYNGTTATFNPPFGASYTVTDPQESRAFVSRSRTLSVGQSPSEMGHGVIQSGIDLNARYGFDDASFDDHSAQWAWPIQTTRPYFQQVLISSQIQPAP